MFDFDDEEQEKKRELWYRPLGEFIVLFSNLEFTANEWIDLVCNSKVTAKHVKDIWSLKKRVSVIIDLIDEYDVDASKKEKWKALWRKAIELMTIRNVIAHNPPFENFRLSLESGRVELKAKKEEIARLNKPLGEPGSGISLKKIVDRSKELRELLIELDKESTIEMIKA